MRLTTPAGADDEIRERPADRIVEHRLKAERQ
jgi:hypothetical protein